MNRITLLNGPYNAVIRKTGVLRYPSTRTNPMFVLPGFHSFIEWLVFWSNEVLLIEEVLYDCIDGLTVNEMRVSMEERNAASKYDTSGRNMQGAKYASIIEGWNWCFRLYIFSKLLFHHLHIQYITFIYKRLGFVLVEGWGYRKTPVLRITSLYDRPISALPDYVRHCMRHLVIV